MRKKLMLTAALALSLAACGQNGSDSYSAAEYDGAAAPMPAPEMARSEFSFDVPPPPPPPAPPPVMDGQPQDQQAPGQTGDPNANADAARQIAYTYSYGFRVPTDNLEAMQNAHKAACEAAGPATCYIEQSNISGLGEDYANGYMRIRASTQWIETFRNAIPENLEPFDATLDSSESTAEDLTTRIIDTTSMLESRKTLRDRLQQLLADRPGKLSDLLEIERELARVQQEIDSTESILAAMKLRVSMSVLTLNYQARYSAVSESIWRPLGDAFEGFLGNVVRSFAALVNLISGLLVWVILLGGLVWLALWRLGKRRKGARKPDSSPKSPTPTAG